MSRWWRMKQAFRRWKERANITVRVWMGLPPIAP